LCSIFLQRNIVKPLTRRQFTPKKNIYSIPLPINASFGYSENNTKRGEKKKKSRKTKTKLATNIAK
jgi:hypothetical protein